MVEDVDLHQGKVVAVALVLDLRGHVSNRKSILLRMKEWLRDGDGPLNSSLSHWLRVLLGLLFLLSLCGKFLSFGLEAWHKLGFWLIVLLFLGLLDGFLLLLKTLQVLLFVEFLGNQLQNFVVIEVVARWLTVTQGVRLIVFGNWLDWLISFLRNIELSFGLLLQSAFLFDG